MTPWWWRRRLGGGVQAAEVEYFSSLTTGAFWKGNTTWVASALDNALQNWQFAKHQECKGWKQLEIENEERKQRQQIQRKSRRRRSLVYQEHCGQEYQQDERNLLIGVLFDIMCHQPSRKNRSIPVPTTAQRTKQLQNDKATQLVEEELEKARHCCSKCNESTAPQVPATATPSERLFSNAKLVCTKKRARSSFKTCGHA